MLKKFKAHLISWTKWKNMEPNFAQAIENLYIKFPELRSRPATITPVPWQLRSLTDDEFRCLCELEGVTILLGKKGSQIVRERAKQLNITARFTHPQGRPRYEAT
jgi:hypothetical protein